MLSTFQQSAFESFQPQIGVRKFRKHQNSAARTDAAAENRKREHANLEQYFNPLTYRHETEEQLWASCGNWDM